MFLTKERPINRIKEGKNMVVFLMEERQIRRKCTWKNALFLLIHWVEKADGSDSELFTQRAHRLLPPESSRTVYPTYT